MLHWWTLPVLLIQLKPSRCQVWPYRWCVAKLWNTKKRKATEDWGGKWKKWGTEKTKEGAGSLWRSVVQLQRGMRPLSPHSPHKICTICSSGCAIQFWQRPLCIIFWGENDGDYHKVFPSRMSVQSPAPLLSLLRAVTWEREALEAPGCMAISLLIDLAPAIRHMTCSLLHMCT